MRKERFQQETELLKKIATWNGFEPDIIDNLIKNFKKKSRLGSVTTLVPWEEPSKRIVLPFNRVLVKGLEKIFHKQGLQVAYKNNNTLKNLLGNPKDKEDELSRAGVYKIQCPECEAYYIGMTKRDIFSRFKEHLSSFNNVRPGTSCVADHISFTGHMFQTADVSLLKPVAKNRTLLSSWESFYIQKRKNENILNLDDGLIKNRDLFRLAIDFPREQN